MQLFYWEAILVHEKKSYSQYGEESWNCKTDMNEERVIINKYQPFIQ